MQAELIKGQDSNESMQYQAGDIIKINFDYPVKLSTLQEIDWTVVFKYSLSVAMDKAKRVVNTGLESAQPSFGKVTLMDEGLGDYVDSIKLLLEDNDNIKVYVPEEVIWQGIVISIPRDKVVDVDNNQADKDVVIILPILIQEFNQIYDGAAATNLIDPGVLPEVDVGTFGSYSELPPGFKIQGVVTSKWLEEQKISSVDELKLGIFYYGDNQESKYINSPDTDIKFLSFIKRENDILYTWEADFPENAVNFLNNISYDDEFFLEWLVNRGDGKQEKIVVGVIQMIKATPRIVGLGTSRDSSKPYHELTLNFNRPLNPALSVSPQISILPKDESIHVSVDDITVDVINDSINVSVK